MSVTAAAGIALGTKAFEAIEVIASKVPSVPQKRRKELWRLKEDLLVKQRRANDYAIAYGETSFPDVLLGLFSEAQEAAKKYESYLVAMAADIQLETIERETEE